MGYVISILSRLFPSPAPGFDSCVARVISVFRSKSARKAAALSESFGGALSPDTAIAAPAAAVAPRTAASVPLKSVRRLFGRFEIVSSDSDRAAAKEKGD